MNITRKKLIPALLTAALSLSIALPAQAYHHNNVVVPNDRTHTQLSDNLYLSRAENNVMQKQAFELASIRIDEALANKDKYDKPLAIAYFMNSAPISATPFHAKAPNKMSFPGYMQAMVNEVDAFLPTHAQFLKFAQDKGIEIFYILYQKPEHKSMIMTQLKNANFPNIDNKHVITVDPDTITKKSATKLGSISDYDVFLGLGDSLKSFNAELKRIYGPFNRTKMAIGPKLLGKFGTRYILIPTKPAYRTLPAMVNRHHHSATNDNAQQEQNKKYLPLVPYSETQEDQNKKYLPLVPYSEAQEEQEKQENLVDAVIKIKSRHIRLRAFKTPEGQWDANYEETKAEK